jgi:PRC-barrel domain
VTSEERLRELEEKYEGYSVYDNRGAKIGKVDDLFIDEADREEYIGVKMGFLGRKSTLIPMDIVRVNEADRAIEVSESKDRVKDAPSFDDDEDITPEYEDRIRSHFGLQSRDPSQTRGSYGAVSDRTRREGDRDYSDRDRTDQEYSDRGDRAERESSAGATGAATGGSAGVSRRGEPTGDRTTPVTRQTEETETFEEGGRTKVRRRIVREEVVEEDPNS